MDIKQYLFLFKRWLWLLILGTVLGGAGAYFYSTRQPELFQTSTKVMVMRPPDQDRYDYTAPTEYELAMTYSQLFTTEPVLQAASEALGFKVNSSVKVRTINDSYLLEITVSDRDPQRAAQVANSLIDALISYNESLQITRYQSSEESLQAQINQVDGQIKSLQDQMNQISQETLKTQQQDVEARISSLESEIQVLKSEISALTPLTPTPSAPAPTEKAKNASATLTPEPTATLTEGEIANINAKAALLSEKQNKLEELQSTLDLYREVYTNLLVYGQSVKEGDQASRQDQMQATLALYQQIYSNLLNSYENIRLARLRSTPNVVQIEKARVPVSPVQPQPTRNGVIGAFCGLFLMSGIAFLIEYLDDTLKNPEDISRALGLPVLGLIGEIHGGKGKKAYPYVAENPRSPIAESFRTLRTNLEFAGASQPLRTVLVTSASPGEGKSTVSVNLAVVLAQGDRKVTLLDADLRRPNVHCFFDISNRTGLTDIFRKRLPPQEVVNLCGDPPLKIITSGSIPPNPTEVLGSERFKEILDALRASNDIVVIDTAPGIVSDPVVLSARVDGVLIVIQPGKTKIDAAQAFLEQLERSGGRILGVVLNPISKKNASYYAGKYRYYSSQYYTSGYDFYTGEQERSNGHKPKERKREKIQ